VEKKNNVSCLWREGQARNMFCFGMFGHVQLRFLAGVSELVRSPCRSFFLRVSVWANPMYFDQCTTDDRYSPSDLDLVVATWFIECFLSVPPLNRNVGDNDIF